MPEQHPDPSPEPAAQYRAALARRIKGLYLILTDPRAGYEALAEIAVQENVAAIQLRAKGLDSGPLLELARRLRAITRNTSTLFFVNDRPDIARLAEADGVHLGQTDLTVADARAIVGEWMLIGKSTHNPRELTAALMEKPDCIGIGPVFGTASKADAAPTLGLARAVAMLRQAAAPAIAIGGIDESNLSDLLKTGALCYALIACVGTSHDPRAVIRRLKAIEQSAF